MNRELEAFAYSVSHDLKAPLRAIDGFSRTLLKEHAGRLTSGRGRDYLGRVRRAARRLEHLTDDLLRLSQISRSELKQADIDLSGLAKSILQELHTAHPDRDVHWTVVPGLGAQGDADLVRIMLTNLLQNAWKFTSKHDHASIEVGCVTYGAEPVFFVKDDGAGFDSVYAEKIFVPFRRLHHASEYEGTGIGLTIAQRIVSRHGGRIWAEASTGHGATFFFTLPAGTPAAGA